MITAQPLRRAVSDEFHEDLVEALEASGWNVIEESQAVKRAS